MDEFMGYVECVNGKSKGKWFTFPISEEKVRVSLGVDENAELEITDFDLPFTFNVPGCTVKDLSDFAVKFNEIDDVRVRENADAIMTELGLTIVDFLESAPNIRFYEGVQNDSDLGRFCFEDREIFLSKEMVERYFDFDAYGRDVCIEGMFLYEDGGVFELT